MVEAFFVFSISLRLFFVCTYNTIIFFILSSFPLFKPHFDIIYIIFSPLSPSAILIPPSSAFQTFPSDHFLTFRLYQKLDPSDPFMCTLCLSAPSCLPLLSFMLLSSLSRVHPSSRLAFQTFLWHLLYDHISSLSNFLIYLFSFVYFLQI